MTSMIKVIGSFHFSMSKIKVLSDNLANQIAAGEVVERPASVIKELIENSIDAGSTRIKVEIELGGRRLMRISDDGEGMSRDDSILCFERHATSKITSLDDLGRISTLGFRGEAMASIASVAKVELVTNNDENAAGTRVEIEGGRLIDVKDASRARGTTISVRDLFFNTPARRKFMRSEATENYHITAIVTHYALAHPSIAFTLVNSGRETIAASPANDLKERAFQIFGNNIIESLIPVEGGREYAAKVSGFISAPRERRSNTDSQYFFVNQRFVRDKIISDGLREGYRSVLPHGVYPVAFLFIEVPVEEIDVNVHPAKTEVRFRRGDAVKDVVAEAVRQSLAQIGAVSADDEDRNVHNEELERSIPVREFPSSDVKADGNESSFEADSHELSSAAPQNLLDFDSGQVPLAYEPQPEIVRSIDSPQDLQTDISTTFEKKVQTLAFQERTDTSGVLYDIPEKTELPRDYRTLPPVDSAQKVVRSIEVDGLSRSKIRPISQLHDSFIIAVDDEGLLLIDQHVAHERILFDKFRKKESERPIESQNLLLPETFDLTPAQAEAFRLIEDELAALGFGVMALSGRTVAIRSIPTDLPAAEARNLFNEILDAIEIEKHGNPKAGFRDDIAASLACKAAVKINMQLSIEKMQWLIDRLLLTSSPTTCPHGRPVILRLTMKDIERGFQRT